MSKPEILLARAVFPETVQRLKEHFHVRDNPDDHVWSGAELVQKMQGVQGVLTTTADLINESLLAQCKDLKICANMAVGFNNFDLQAMTRHAVQATNTPDVLTQTTADMGFALLMAIARRMSESERFLRQGAWHKWSYDLLVGHDIHGSTLGILGMGRIGQAIARRAALGFDMQVIYHNRTRLSVADEQACGGARYVDRDTLLRESDHLMLVLPYSAQTHHCIGATELAQMKPSATLINIARGGLVDEDALIQALRQGRIAGAALDVFEGEPTVKPEWLDLPNVVLTPHIGSASWKTRRAMADLAADNLIAYLVHGKALNPVNRLA